MSVKTARASAGQWLSLGEAASRLGVDEATLRHWADTGKVPTFRTPGGHRRFREGDLETLLRSDIPRVDNLADLVERRSARVLAGSPARPLRSRAWFARLDEDTRARARAYGRELLSAVVRFMGEPGARRSIREHLLEQAKRYGANLTHARVAPADAADAFRHFRELILRLVVNPRGRGGMLDEAQIKTLLEVSTLLDEIFAEILRAWTLQRPESAGSAAANKAGVVQ